MVKQEIPSISDSQSGPSRAHLPRRATAHQPLHVLLQDLRILNADDVPAVVVVVDVVVVVSSRWACRNDERQGKATTRECVCIIPMDRDRPRRGGCSLRDGGPSRDSEASQRGRGTDPTQQVVMDS